MLPILISLVIVSLLVGLLSIWRQNRKLRAEAQSGLQAHDAERADELEKANDLLKRAQAELQRRWQYPAEAQRLSHSGTFGWKVRSGELVWSDETYEILGLARQTNPTLDLVFDRVHPDDLDRVRQLSDRAAQNGMDLDVEHRILLPDGVIKYVHAVAHAGRDSSGNLEYMGVVTDITERKLAEEERQALSRNLQESKARLEEAQRVAHMGHYYWDLIANRVTWSDELYRIYSLTPQEGPIDMAMVSEMIHPDDREHVFRAAEESVRSGVHSEAEHRVVRPDGEVRTVQGLGTVKTDAEGRAYEMFGTVQDITERKRAEEERQLLSRDLQESKTWLEEAQRVTHVGYWVWDLETNRLISSDEHCRILGLTPKKGPIDLAIVREIIHPEDREYVFRTAEEAIRSGERADCEHRIVRPNGEMRIVHSLGDLKKDPSGRPYQMFGTTQDITDRKRGEEALRRSQFYLSEGQRLAHMGSWAAKDLGVRWSDDLGIYWSDEVYKIFGLDPQKGPPNLEQYLAAVHPDDRASMEETIRAMHEQRTGCDVTHRIVRPDGEVRHVRCVGVPVFEDGVFKAFHGTTIDVTEHALLTEELRRERAYLTDAQSMAHIGSWVYNVLTNKVLYSSDENARLYGFDLSQGSISAKRFFDTQHAEDAPRVNATLERAVREGTDFYLDEYRIHHTDGSIRFLRAIGHRNPSGEAGEYVG